MMTEDAEEYAPLWWKLRWYKDVNFENKLMEAIRAKDKPSTGIVYRIFLGVSGILLFITGLLIWNIPLNSPDDPRLLGSVNAAIGAEWDWFLFSLGLFVQFIIGPYFAFVSVSNSGRLFLLMPKAQLEYFRLKGAIADREVHDHYWEALRDPDHEHHNEIIRYKWMDKVRWKHHPSDFFGYQIFTKESGEEVQGPLVPKSSDEYRNSNFTLDGNGEPVFEGPTHPLKRILTLPMVLFIFGLVSFPISVINAIISITDNVWEILFQISIGFLMMILLGNYLIRRNTDLINADADASLEDLEERLRLLCERYVAIP
jgi:hypothetical protein